MRWLTVTPAYGRDYRSAKAAKDDWKAGKDFQIATMGPDAGRYINKQDAEEAGVKVTIRYDRLRKVTAA